MQVFRNMAVIAMTIMALTAMQPEIANAATNTNLTLASVSNATAAPRANSSIVAPRMTVTKASIGMAPAIDSANYAKAFSEFEATAIPRESVVRDGTRTVTFHFPNGLSMTLVDPATARHQVVPNVSGGTNKYGIWIGFNQFDQNALSNGIAGAAITAAICLIPAVGNAACAVVGLVVGVAVTYIHRNGVCSGNRTLYWFDGPGSGSMVCANRPPYT